MANETNRDGVYLNPSTGDIIASGRVTASGINLPNVQNVVIGDKTLEELLGSGGSSNPLDGNTYDFSSNETIYKAIGDLIVAFGGTVTNMPSKAHGYTVKVADDAHVGTKEYLLLQFEDGSEERWDSFGISKGSVIATNVSRIGFGGRIFYCDIRYTMNGVTGNITSNYITWIDLTGDLTITYAEGDA